MLWVSGQWTALRLRSVTADDGRQHFDRLSDRRRRTTALRLRSVTADHGRQTTAFDLWSVVSGQWSAELSRGIESAVKLGCGDGFQAVCFAKLI